MDSSTDHDNSVNSSSTYKSKFSNDGGLEHSGIAANILDSEGDADNEESSKFRDVATKKPIFDSSSLFSMKTLSRLPAHGLVKFIQNRNGSALK